MLEFFTEPHEYRLDGVVVPGVTSILTAVLGDPFARVPRDTLFRAQQLGKAVHLATQLDDQGELDDQDIHPEVLLRVRAWRQFRKDSGFVPHIIEEPMCDPELGFAGTPDRVGSMNGMHVQIDLKNGTHGRRAGIQTAAYNHLILTKHGLRPRRFVLGFQKDGKYKLVPHSEDTRDTNDWWACWRVYRLINERSH